jgi:PEP-CTERM motif
MRPLARIALALAVTGMAASGPAWALCVAGNDVDGTVAQTGAASWTYNYSVLNGCVPDHQPLLTNFYLPYFPDAGITDINVAATDINGVTWTYSIDPNDNLFGLAGAGVIDFQITSMTDVGFGSPLLLPGAGYGGWTGFSFTADYGSVEGPWAMLLTAYDGGQYDMTTTLYGDPPIPASPDTLAALNATVPEPGTLGLLAIGLCMTGLVLGRRTLI